MMPPTTPMVNPVITDDGHIGIVYCNEAFTFAPGHRMRAAPCLICQRAIGGEPASVVGAVALCGDACSCGCVTSDVYLTHAAHFPLPPADLETALHRALECTDRN